MAPAWTSVTLDTKPPVVVAEAVSRVLPPDPWVVLVRSNEDLGPCSATYLDMLGLTHSVGIERVTSRLLRIVVPTTGLLSGTLMVIARDLVCNPTVIETFVTVVREDPFGVTLTIEHGLEVVLTVDHGFDGTTEIDHAYVTDVTLDHAYEGAIEVSRGIDATLEITDG